MLTCPHCHKDLGWEVRHCPFCGRSQRLEKPASSQAPAIARLDNDDETPPSAFANQDNTFAQSGKDEIPPAAPLPAWTDKPLSAEPKKLRQHKPLPKKGFHVPWLFVALVMIALAALPVWEKYGANKFAEPEMVLIKAGCFDMGSPQGEAGRYPDERQHKICLKNFYIAKYEVTFQEYDRYAHASQRPLPKGDGRGRRPVTGISWTDAYDYAAWLSEKTGKPYRLPSEAEWEYVARAGTMTVNFWGDSLQQGCLYMNNQICPGSPGHADPVGAFKPNPWGLYDMLGNVFEMTGSIYDGEYGGGERRVASPEDAGFHVVRGGSWYPDDSTLRSAWRGRTDSTSADSRMGFRLARD